MSANNRRDRSPLAACGNQTTTNRKLVVTGLAIAVAIALCEVPARARNAEVALFDGRSLDGWEVVDRDQALWSVADGAITGGSLEKEVPHNTYISTKKSFQNFD